MDKKEKLARAKAELESTRLSCLAFLGALIITGLVCVRLMAHLGYFN